MDSLLEQVIPVFHSGLGNLAAYLAAHVLLCLLPAFFIAGGDVGAYSQGNHHAFHRPLGKQAR